MRGTSAGFRLGLPLACVTAVTTWLTMLGWRGFAVAWGDYLSPLLLLTVIVVAVGVGLRWSQLPGWAGILVELAVVAIVTWLILGGSPLHPLDSAAQLRLDAETASRTANTWASPVPANQPTIRILLIPPGALALVVMDYLACWRRRVSLAGLPLLAIYSVPISLLGGGVSWLVFAFAASGFLLMLFLQETDHVTRWGRPLGARGGEADPGGFGVSNGASRASAGSVGIVALVLAVILPVFVPTLHIGSLGLFGPGGSGSGVKIVNPITDMRRDLVRGKDVPLLELTTENPDPSYLRIAVLTRFDGVEWSAGNRSIVSDQTANGLVPLEQGLDGTVATRSYRYAVHAFQDFDSRWLPTAFPVSSIVADGDWHYDETTMDFVAGDNHTTTAGEVYDMTEAEPVLSGYKMADSLTAPLSIQNAYTSLPSTLPPVVSQYAQRVTANAGSRFEKMLALQQWFRSGGGFTYSLQVAQGGGNAAMEQFLDPGQGGRTGYCEQFASAFALMARSLSIPARVAVGFLHPDKVSRDHFVFSAHDLHAWPEVYFEGSGWVRFEPTPGSRAGSVPPYTQGNLQKPEDPTTNDPTSRKAIPSDTASAQHHDNTVDATSASSGGPGIPWRVVLLVLLVVALLVLVGFVPRAVRRARRRRRLAGRAEDVWDELRDSAVDIGAGWPTGRSPQEIAGQVVSWFGPEPDGAPQVRPPRGRGLAPDADDALDRIVRSVERVRYARTSDDRPGALAADAERCLAALEHGASRAMQRRAHWWPRSVFTRSPARPDQPGGPDRPPEPVGAGNIVDHVG